MRPILCLAVVCVLLVFCLGSALAAAPIAASVLAAPAAEAPKSAATVVPVSVPEPLSAAGLRYLTMKERTAFGLTFSNVRRIRKDLVDNGFITATTSRAEQTVMIQGIIMAEARASGDPAVVGINWDEIDWDAVFAFIERLIQLIMMFF